MADRRFLRRARSAFGAALVAALTGAAPTLHAQAPAADAMPGRAQPLASDPALEARMRALAAELRCLVCQNQTIADSSADLAVDLRQQVREMLGRGMSEDQIRTYMTDRYGDFVLYRPPLKGSTAVLWIGPAVLLAVAVGGLLIVLRRRQRLGADAFDPETPEDDVPNGADR